MNKKYYLTLLAFLVIGISFSGLVYSATCTGTKVNSCYDGLFPNSQNYYDGCTNLYQCTGDEDTEVCSQCIQEYNYCWTDVVNQCIRDSCGDGTCNNGETSATCPVDCEVKQLTVSSSTGGYVGISNPSENVGAGNSKTYTYLSTTSVTLTATAYSGNKFVGWSGACTGTGSCIVSVDGIKSVSASFTPYCGDGTCNNGETSATCPGDCGGTTTTYSLKIYLAGTGTGNVIGKRLDTNEIIINCPGDCEENNLPKSLVSPLQVQLTATATQGDFISWTGNGPDNPLTISMNSNKEITANFNLVSASDKKLEVVTTEYDDSSGDYVYSYDYAIKCNFDSETGRTCSAFFSGETTLSSYWNACFWLKEGSSSATFGYPYVADLQENEKVYAYSTPALVTQGVLIKKENIGKVTTVDGRIDCGEDCYDVYLPTYLPRSTVTLVATPDTGYKFDRWQGDICDGVTSSTCSHTFSTLGGSSGWESKLNIIYAKFLPIENIKLNGSIVGAGILEFSKLDKGLCSNGQGICKIYEKDNSQIQITALPDSNYVFNGWTGDCFGQDETCTLTLDGDKTFSAVFEYVEPKVKLNIKLNSVNDGSVSVFPIAIDCTPDEGYDICKEYTSGMNVNLEAVANVGKAFYSWAGDCFGNIGNCSLTMNSNKSVTANFGIAKYTVKINSIPTGVGDFDFFVGYLPVSCGLNCKFYAHGSAAAIIANEVEGYIFNGWQGCDSIEGKICNVHHVYSNIVVNATYEPIVNYDFTVKVDPSLEGYVAVTPESISPYEVYTEDTKSIAAQEVTLLAAPNEGNNLIKWVDFSDESNEIEICNVNGIVQNPCVVNVDANKKVKAIFSLGGIEFCDGNDRNKNGLIGDSFEIINWTLGTKISFITGSPTASTTGIYLDASFTINDESWESTNEKAFSASSPNPIDCLSVQYTHNIFVPSNNKYICLKEGDKTILLYDNNAKDNVIWWAKGDKAMGRLSRDCSNAVDSSGNLLKGICSAGKNYCNGTGYNTTCQAYTQPTKEIIGNNLDDNCDGNIDEVCDEDNDGYFANSECAKGMECCEFSSGNSRFLLSDSCISAGGIAIDRNKCQLDCRDSKSKDPAICQDIVCYYDIASNIYSYKWRGEADTGKGQIVDPKSDSYAKCQGAISPICNNIAYADCAVCTHPASSTLRRCGTDINCEAQSHDEAWLTEKGFVNTNAGWVFNGVETLSSTGIVNSNKCAGYEQCVINYGDSKQLKSYIIGEENNLVNHYVNAECGFNPAVNLATSCGANIVDYEYSINPNTKFGVENKFNCVEDIKENTIISGRYGELGSAAFVKLSNYLKKSNSDFESCKNNFFKTGTTSWSESCVIKDKCLDGVDNDGKEDLNGILNKFGVSTGLTLKKRSCDVSDPKCDDYVYLSGKKQMVALVDGDDPECYNRGWNKGKGDSDNDAFLGTKKGWNNMISYKLSNGESAANIANDLGIDVACINNLEDKSCFPYAETILFPDCDNFDGDDEDTLAYRSRKDSTKIATFLENANDPTTEVKYSASDIHPYADLTAGIPEQFFAVLQGKTNGLGICGKTGGGLPFSSEELTKEIAIDVNCNKDGYEGYSADFENGITNWDDDINTGMEIDSRSTIDYTFFEDSTLVTKELMKQPHYTRGRDLMCYHAIDYKPEFMKEVSDSLLKVTLVMGGYFVLGPTLAFAAQGGYGGGVATAAKVFSYGVGAYFIVNSGVTGKKCMDAISEFYSDTSSVWCDALDQGKGKKECLAAEKIQQYCGETAINVLFATMAVNSLSKSSSSKFISPRSTWDAKANGIAKQIEAATTRYRIGKNEIIKINGKVSNLLKQFEQANVNIGPSGATNPVNHILPYDPQGLSVRAGQIFSQPRATTVVSLKGTEAKAFFASKDAALASLRISGKVVLSGGGKELLSFPVSQGSIGLGVTNRVGSTLVYNQNVFTLADFAAKCSPATVYDIFVNEMKNAGSNVDISNSLASTFAQMYPGVPNKASFLLYLKHKADEGIISPLLLTEFEKCLADYSTSAIPVETAVGASCPITSPNMPFGVGAAAFEELDPTKASAEAGCFLAGTKILMGDGSYKNIEEVVEGDIVVAYDLENKKPENVPVTATFVRNATSYRIIEYEVVEE